MVNSRRKGKDGELEIIKLLKPWWGGVWTRKKCGYAGDDLKAPEDFPCSVEVKNQNAVPVQTFFHPTQTLLAWWNQAKEQAGEKYPMLCLKSSRNWYCAFHMRQYLAHGWTLPPTYMVAQWTPDDLVVVMQLTHFMACNPRKEAA